MQCPVVLGLEFNDVAKRCLTFLEFPALAQRDS